jgi:hypothetical protein
MAERLIHHVVLVDGDVARPAELVPFGDESSHGAEVRAGSEITPERRTPWLGISDSNFDVKSENSSL